MDWAGKKEKGKIKDSFFLIFYLLLCKPQLKYLLNHTNTKPEQVWALKKINVFSLFQARGDLTKNICKELSIDNSTVQSCRSSGVQGPRNVPASSPPTFMSSYPNPNPNHPKANPSPSFTSMVKSLFPSFYPAFIPTWNSQPSLLKKISLLSLESAKEIHKMVKWQACK